MKTIIVATDFSAVAMNAARYAADMALSINADLYLLHISPIPISYTEITMVIDMEALQHGAEGEMDEICKELTRQTADKVYIETKVITGSFFDELESACREISPYAVVMGSQGTTAAQRLMFGGHTVHAMKHLLWPLITVPPNAHFGSLKKIGLACDFEKPVDILPVDEMIKMVNDFHATLYVLNIGKKNVFDPEIVFQSRLLQEKLIDIKPVFNFITGDDINDSIMDFVNKNQIDLLVVFPKRYGLLDTIIHKSHTRQFVLHSHVPVMALQA